MTSSDSHTRESSSNAASAASDAATTIPCHFIIAHPEKPKFLVIRHTGNHWSPPMLNVPAQGALMYKPAEINRGMMKKYKLRTSVMRVVMEASNYSVIELELHASSQQQMQAVWMGPEEYAKFKKRKDGATDPFEKWLREAQAGEVPGLRAPWQRRGWYQVAEAWFSRKLIELEIQVTGSTQQFKAGWPTACLLRVATTQGDIHFKAAYDKPPGEARLTSVLARLWPDHIAKPLATDEKRNWMVMRDFKMRGENRPSIRHLPEFARTMGKIQRDAMDHMDQWHDLNCTNMDPGFLCNEDGRAQDLYTRIHPLLTMGTNPLNEREVVQLENSIDKVRELSEKLAAFKIPNSLAHLDYRPDNFFVENEKIRIIDWADVAVTHPFMTLCRTLDFLENYATDKIIFDGMVEVTAQTRADLSKAYLEAFSGLAPADRLAESFALARKVFDLFYFYYVAGQIQLIEPDTPHSDLLNHLLCSRAKILIRQTEN